MSSELILHEPQLSPETTSLQSPRDGSPHTICDSTSSNDNIPPAYMFQKIPWTAFEIGEWTVRNMLPALIIPRCLNPNWVDCDENDLPLVWFGAPYDEKKVIGFAIANGFGDKRDPEDEIYDARWTWLNLVEQYYKKYGIYLCMQEVWGYNLLILAFHTNRDMRLITKAQRRRIISTYRAMGYKDEEMQWYLDIEEEV
ncbi:hypothetical protein K466DRAFT_158744 [Polyporus arcularius HHB13444]|uniref:Uncharacterized protein n=1 Tax=Polyporus arcularius HHB13444 TaxID=1314778 RepID=A0A5C3PBD7_9APHY|nr:hypothetical protein K466DRAFT_158744 [Polyporus arcularius HHB13444]